MNQKSFTINFFLKLFILKNIKAKKKGRIYMSSTCVQELTLYSIHFILCVCVCVCSGNYKSKTYSRYTKIKDKGTQT